MLTVLLLEDDPGKKNRLLTFLNSRKELFGQVDTVLCSSDALRSMKQTKYDLFIADIVVPSELGGTKNEENTISLLEQIDADFNGLHRPTFCLPISASGELSQEAHNFFQGRPWGILQYTDTTNECLESIEKICRFVIGEKEHQQPVRKCDVFIITALMEPEFAAIESLNLNWSSFEPLDGSQLIKYGEVTVDGQSHVVAAAFCSRMGPVAAGVLTTKALLKLKPKLVIMAGICAGIPGKADLGDLVAADISWDWQSGKHIEKNGIETFQIAPHQLGIDDATRNQMLLFKRDVGFWSRFEVSALRQKLKLPKLIVGPMATGSSVLSDARVADRIKTAQHKNVTGLDMETYGVFAAAEACDPRVKVMSFKSVCDKGDIKKNDNHQEYAATVSAASVLHFLENYAGPLLR